MVMRGMVGAAALIAILTGSSAAWAGPPTRAELEQRERDLQNGAAATQQRDLQARTTADRQKQLLEYQVRKSQRNAVKSQCRAAGLPNC